MKKVRRMAVLLIVTAMLMSACGNIADGSIDSGEIVVPEMSSEELLVSSLEYLLQDDEDGVEEAEEPAVEETDQEVEPVSGETEEENEPEEVEPEQEHIPNEKEAVIYYGNAGSYELSREIIQIEEKTPEELLNALSRHNIVSLDTKVLSFEEREEAGEKVLYLNLSRAVNEYLKTMSKEAECVILASIVNTFLENYDADGVNIVVDEKPLATKNAEYVNALRKCTPGELLERFAVPEKEDETGEPQEQGTEEPEPVSEDVEEDMEPESEENP